MTNHKIVNREEWTDARNELLVREKEHTRQGDDLARQRRELPWVPVDKEYRFETDEGTRTLAASCSPRSSCAASRRRRAGGPRDRGARIATVL